VFLRARGLEPADATVYVFGGAGPLHLWAPMQRLGIRRARSFPFGSAFSAFGCTVVDIRHRYEVAWDAADAPSAERLGGVLERLLRRGLGDARAEGATGGQVHGTVLLLGKDGHTMAESAPVGGLDRPGALDELVNAALAGDGWSAVHSIALVVTVPVPRAEPPAAPAPAAPVAATRPVWWAGQWLPTPVRGWGEPGPGETVAGPVLLTERDTTHALGPGWDVTIDERGNALWTAG
jgi:N-methylhydantoinase A